MLQQTRVETVRRRFPEFVGRFPDLASLARASEAEVLALWSGLGYYQRARRLHAAARQLWEGSGKLPDSLAGWMALPGVGRSTAGAVLSLGMGRAAVVLDANVRRVLTRLLGAPAEAELWRLAEQLLPQRDAATYNQALMDLGALLCSPREPRCAECPLRRRCPVGAGEVDWRESLPAAGPRGSGDREERLCWLALHTPQGWLLERRPAGGVWPSLWTPLQGADLDQCRDSAAALGWNCGPVRRLGQVRWQLTHKRLLLQLHSARALHGSNMVAEGEPQAVTVSSAAQLRDLGMPTPALRWLRGLVENGAASP